MTWEKQIVNNQTWANTDHNEIADKEKVKIIVYWFSQPKHIFFYKYKPERARKAQIMDLKLCYKMLWENNKSSFLKKYILAL